MKTNEIVLGVCLAFALFWYIVIQPEYTNYVKYTNKTEITLDMINKQLDQISFGIVMLAVIVALKVVFDCILMACADSIKNDLFELLNKIHTDIRSKNTKI